jgi:hypothetical protein
MELLLTAIRMVARDTNLYTFERSDRGALLPAEPGAHIGVILPNGIERQYSLLQSGPDLRQYTVGVKRDANSRGGSLFMHDQLKVGSKVAILPPRNNFPLNENAELVVLIAGGIGITPIYCMAQRLIASRAPGSSITPAARAWTRPFLTAASAESALPLRRREGGKFLQVAKIIDVAPKSAHLLLRAGPCCRLRGCDRALAARTDSRRIFHAEIRRGQRRRLRSRACAVQARACDPAG